MRQPIPPYRTEFDDDAAFIDAFETGTLPFEEWCHSAHLRLAWIYLTRHEPSVALARLREGIRAFNRAHDVPDEPLSGYHETITQAWVRIVAGTIRGQDPCRTSMEFLEQHPHLRVRTLLRVFYSRARILSPEAKRAFVEPDLAALPGA